MSGTSAASILSIGINYNSSEASFSNFWHEFLVLKHLTVSGGIPHVIHWTMLSDGRFEFSPSLVMSSEQYDHYHQDNHHQDTTTLAPVTESVPYDPYDEMFAVSGYDLPAYGNEVYDSQNSSYNIVKY